VKGAINDCQAGREGGGRAGMDRWIRTPQNRAGYWQNLVSPALAQAQARAREEEARKKAERDQAARDQLCKENYPLHYFYGRCPQ